MASETRQLPDSNRTRLEALNAAVSKNTAMGVNSFLTTQTKTRLVTIQPLYKKGYDDIGFKKQALNTLSAQEEAARAPLKMVVSHFIQVFNMAVDRGVFAAADRAYFKLEVSKAEVPPLTNDADLLLWADNLVTGETQRIADGGTALAFPSLAEVTAAQTAFVNVHDAQNTATEALDTAQEALAAQNEEADKVIKKVWDEVETFYNEEEEASMRQNARLWGVVYQRVGGNKKISGRVTDRDSHSGIADVKMSMKNGKGSVLTDAEGNFELSTTLMDAQLLDAEKDGYGLVETPVTLEEGKDQVVNVIMIMIDGKGVIN